MGAYSTKKVRERKAVIIKDNNKLGDILHSNTKTIDTITQTPNQSSSATNSNIILYPEISFSENIKYNNIILHRTLDGFLLDNITHYTCFAKYLMDNFSYENLLFIKDALIYKNILIKIKNSLLSNNINCGNKTPSVSNEDLKEEYDYIDASFNIKTEFKYLHDMHKEMYNKLGSKYLKRKITDKIVPELHKKAELIFTELYNEYISENAKYPVNLSFVISMQLNYYAKNADKLKYINDYIYVWDTALRETWRILSGTYIHNFKPYIRSIQNT